MMDLFSIEEKPIRGGFIYTYKAMTQRVKSSKRNKAKRGSASKVRVKPLCCERTFQMQKSQGTLVRGIERNESCGGSWKGETSESFNPMDGFGTKQDRCGVRRNKTLRGFRKPESGAQSGEVNSM